MISYWFLLVALALLPIACYTPATPLPTPARLAQVDTPVNQLDTSRPSPTITNTLTQIATATSAATIVVAAAPSDPTATSRTLRATIVSSVPPTQQITRTSKPMQTISLTPTTIVATSLPPTSPPPISPLATQTPLPPSPSPGVVALPYVIEPASPPVANLGVWTSESTLTILTYSFEQAFIPTSPDDPVYPYPRLNFSQVGPPLPKNYRAIHLENGYVSLTILPELGGRIYRWLDKTTGRQLLYQNPVIKPTSWGYRGWWLAAGGIEWAFPVEEHGLNEWRPWNVSIGGASITVSNVDDRTGMEVGATVSLNAGSSAVTLQPYARNDTEQAHEYQLWLNAMLALSGNTVSPETEFIVPASQVTIHSSGDGGAPGAGGSMSWPIHGGRAMNFYGNWQGHIGFFFPPAGFAALYDHVAQQGIVRSHAPGWPAGAKFFGPAGYSPSYWTDNGSNYVELWSGATPTFWANGILQPGQSVSWSERWYPISRLGGVTFANAAAALRLTEKNGEVEVGVVVSSSVQLMIELFANNEPLSRWRLSLSPGQAFRTDWTRDRDGALGLRVSDNAGNILAQTGELP